MKKYKVVVGEKMNEDELPEDLPQELYDWWFELSTVDGVRIGPAIYDKNNKVDLKTAIRMGQVRTGENAVIANLKRLGF